MQDQLSNRQEADPKKNQFGFPELGIGVRGDVTWHGDEAGSVYFYRTLLGFVI